MKDRINDIFLNEFEKHMNIYEFCSRDFDLDFQAGLDFTTYSKEDGDLIREQILNDLSKSGYLKLVEIIENHFKNYVMPKYSFLNNFFEIMFEMVDFREIKNIVDSCVYDLFDEKVKSDSQLDFLKD